MLSRSVTPAVAHAFELPMLDTAAAIPVVQSAGIMPFV
jgi:hypothetical protein